MAAMPVPFQLIFGEYFPYYWRKSIQYHGYYSTIESQLRAIPHRRRSSSYFALRIMWEDRINKNRSHVTAE